MLIVFEGLDGTGKTTQINLLYQYLKQKRPARLYREPGGTAIGEQLRSIIKSNALPSLTQVLLFSAARSLLLSELVDTTQVCSTDIDQLPLPSSDKTLTNSAARPEQDSTLQSASHRSKTVILLDRYIYSTYAYQSDHAALIENINKDLNPPRPDLVVFFQHKYRSTATDELEKLDQDQILNSYLMQRDHTWLMVPRLSKESTFDFIRTHIDDLLIGY